MEPSSDARIEVASEEAGRGQAVGHLSPALNLTRDRHIANLPALWLPESRGYPLLSPGIVFRLSL
jgi:hypothetical protein